MQVYCCIDAYHPMLSTYTVYMALNILMNSSIDNSDGEHTSVVHVEKQTMMMLMGMLLP
jgi:hypothetical protein